ncbi:putative squamosa promoter-binding-like protein 19 isoform X2 [Bidens hawaiensis]|uniref:putative squamosa promoter-binding-like protein 19 isoform X2 n=1 Tax=Bidens hawaiensis TaxID=980011 RepID=UPI0040493A4E
MDWVFTPSSPWDLTELDIDDFDVSDVFSGSGDGIFNKLSDQEHTIMSSSSSALSKNPRGDLGEQHASCLVDGCEADLSSCREYHRRHRVCETHSKTPVVTIGGKEQRFCQQCSRFHSLGEFDEVKRSCRKRLDGHNRRRRKPRPESMYLNCESFYTNHQGTKLLSFGGSPAMTFGESRQKQKFNERTPSDSNTSFFKKRRFPFLLGVDSDKVNQPFTGSSFQQAVNTSASSGVLYLLSNSKHVHHASVSGPANSLVQSSGSLSQHSSPHLPTRNVTGLNSGHTNSQFMGMIHFRTEGLLENEAAQLLSFSCD